MKYKMYKDELRYKLCKNKQFRIIVCKQIGIIIYKNKYNHKLKSNCKYIIGINLINMARTNFVTDLSCY